LERWLITDQRLSFFLVITSASAAYKYSKKKNSISELFEYEFAIK
jgi:hypothetical protein